MKEEEPLPETYTSRAGESRNSCVQIPASELLSIPLPDKLSGHACICPLHCVVECHGNDNVRSTAHSLFASRRSSKLYRSEGSRFAPQRALLLSNFLSGTYRLRR